MFCIDGCFILLVLAKCILLAMVDETRLEQRNLELVFLDGRWIGELSNMEKLDWFTAELVAKHCIGIDERDETGGRRNGGTGVGSMSM